MYKATMVWATLGKGAGLQDSRPPAFVLPLVAACKDLEGVVVLSKPLAPQHVWSTVRLVDHQGRGLADRRSPIAALLTVLTHCQLSLVESQLRCELMLHLNCLLMQHLLTPAAWAANAKTLMGRPVSDVDLQRVIDGCRALEASTVCVTWDRHVVRHCTSDAVKYHPLRPSTEDTGSLALVAKQEALTAIAKGLSTAGVEEPRQLCRQGGKLLRIERVYAPRVDRMVRMRTACMQADDAVVQYRLGFHGTSTSGVHSINHRGFRVSKSTRKSYGAGTCEWRAKREIDARTDV